MASYAVLVRSACLILTQHDVYQALIVARAMACYPDRLFVKPCLSHLPF